MLLHRNSKLAYCDGVKYINQTGFETHWRHPFGGAVYVADFLACAYQRADPRSNAHCGRVALCEPHWAHQD